MRFRVSREVRGLDEASSAGTSPRGVSRVSVRRFLASAQTSQTLEEQCFRLT